MDRRGEMVFLMVGGLFSGCRLSTGIKALREGLQVCYFNTRRVQVNWFLMQFIKKKTNPTNPFTYTVFLLVAASGDKAVTCGGSCTLSGIMWSKYSH